jgi:uncharacterized protein (TIGR02391 family)
MNLETRLEPPLWEAVRASIEARNFSAAVLDSIHYLSDVIRERSGLEGDGVALVGAAFGGNAPKLKVNRLQTESEQNVQRGVEALLRGVYQAIRNPRSHGTTQDDERNAVAIILFVDYLLRIVDQSRTPFTLASFVARVFDPHFVPKALYAELLVKEIPEKQKLAVCREVFARRSEANTTNTAVFCRALLAKMTPDEVDEFYELVSEELTVTEDDDTVRFALGSLPAEHWKKVSEVARVRVENKLVTSVKAGKYNKATGRCLSGGLGTWATSVVDQFVLADDLWRAVAMKLRSTEALERDYVINYFTTHIERCFEAVGPPLPIIAAVNQGLREGDVRFKELVTTWSWEFSSGDMKERAEDSPWRKPFKVALDKFMQAVEEPPMEPITDDDIPF